MVPARQDPAQDMWLQAGARKLRERPPEEFNFFLGRGWRIFQAGTRQAKDEYKVDLDNAFAAMCEGVLHHTQEASDGASESQFFQQFTAESIGGSFLAFDVASGQIDVAALAIAAEEDVPAMQADAAGDDLRNTCRMVGHRLVFLLGGRGLEPRPSSAAQNNKGYRRTQGDAGDQGSYSELAEIVRVWPSLVPPLRAAILAIVRKEEKKGGQP